MEQTEQSSVLLKELCLEIATGDVGSERFTRLLLETGIILDEKEWDAANRVLTRSECMYATYSMDELTAN